MSVVDLTLRRLDRVEKAQRETNERLARLETQVEESLGRVVEVLEAHSRHFERMEDALIGISERVDRVGERVDRLATAIARGRTQDLARSTPEGAGSMSVTGARRRQLYLICKRRSGRNHRAVMERRKGVRHGDHAREDEAAGNGSGPGSV